MYKKTFQFKYSDLDLKPRQIERILGDSKDENQVMVSNMIEEVLEEAGHICEIKAEYVVFPEIAFDRDARSINIGGIDFNIGRIIWGQLKKAESAALFLCTAGERIGERSRQLISDKDFLKGYIYDIAGSEIVEAAADMMQENLRLDMKPENMQITNRFSPGYCGWNVSEQHNLFRLIPGNFCGITLTDSALMMPIKSVSGLIGIGSGVRFRPYTCNFCDQKDCVYRSNSSGGTIS